MYQVGIMAYFRSTRWDKGMKFKAVSPIKNVFFLCTEISEDEHSPNHMYTDSISGEKKLGRLTCTQSSFIENEMSDEWQHCVRLFGPSLDSGQFARERKKKTKEQAWKQFPSAQVHLSISVRGGTGSQAVGIKIRWVVWAGSGCNDGHLQTELSLFSAFLCCDP